MTHQPALATSPEVPIPIPRSRAARLLRVGILVAAVLSLAVILAWVWRRAHPELLTPQATEVTGTAPAAPGADADSAQKASKAAFAERYGLDRGAVVTSSSAPETNADSPRSEADAFARRYGIRPVPAASGTNAIFNVNASGTAPLSYQWRFGTNGTTGATAPTPGGLLITKLTPLCLKLTLESVTPMDSGTRYDIGLENEAAASPRERSKRQYYCSLNTSGKQDIFTLREAKVPPDNPTNVTMVLELKDSGERVAVSKDHPFQRVDGYAADLRYEPEHKTWINRRVGNVLAFGDDEAQIIAITRTEVVIGTKSSVKTWAIELKGPPADQTGAPGIKAIPNQP